MRNKIKISEEKFEEYVEQQYTGHYNMLDWRRGVVETTLSKKEWLAIITYYGYYENQYPTIVEKWRNINE